MLKHTIRLLAAAAGLAAVPAGAVTYTLGAANSGPVAPTGYATVSCLATFDATGNIGTCGSAFPSANIRTGTNGNQYAAPFGDTTNYFAVGPSTSTPVSVSFTLPTSTVAPTLLSLYIGSVDTYNSITFNGLGVTFTGADFLAGAQNSTVSRNVTFQLSAAEAAAVTGITFASASNAFEFDNFQFGLGAVPEPASWAMMIAGFGLAGAAMRRRRKVSGVAFA